MLPRSTAATANVPGIESLSRLQLESVQILKQCAIIWHERISIRRKQQARQKLIGNRQELNQIYAELSAACSARNNLAAVAAVAACRRQWAELEEITVLLPPQSALVKVLELSEALRRKNEALLKSLANEPDRATLPEVTHAGELGVLATKLACSYLAAGSNGPEKAAHVSAMLAAARQFDKTIARLEQSAENTAHIQGVIHSISKMEWRRLRQYASECAASGDFESRALVMVVFSNTVVEKSQRLAGLYAALQE